MVTDLATKDQIDSFSARLRSRAERCRSWLCVGLDPDPAKLPPSVPPTAPGITDFCRNIIEATAESAVCFKINFAFFEALGRDGWAALEDVRGAIPRTLPVIADAKRGDIANTAAAYADAILSHLDFDAVTVSPYLGWDSLRPFLSQKGKGVFVLCRTSNPGSADLQELQVGGEPLFLRVAREVLALETSADLGLVVGATQPAALRAVRELGEDVMLLMPGVGAQGASVREAIDAGGNGSGRNALVSVSRQVIFASSLTDYPLAAASAARSLAAQTVETIQ